MARIKDISGRQFGSLIVESLSDRRGAQYDCMWWCICECGNRKEILARALRSGNTKSCGCVAIRRHKEVMDSQSKNCAKCGQMKPLSSFYPNKGGLGGKSSNCKICAYRSSSNWAKRHPVNRASSHSKWVGKNADHVRKYSRNRRKNNLEKIRGQERAAYARNAEKKAKAARDMRARDKDAYNRMVKARRDANPFIMKSAHGNRRAREIGGRVTKEDIGNQLISQGGHCYYCWKDISGSKYDVDHFISLAAGGKHAPSNIVIACVTCNSRKNKFCPFSFLKKIGIEFHPLRRAA